MIKHSIPKLEVDCCIQEIKFFQNFIGYVTSIVLLNKFLNDEYVILLRRFKNGIYSEKHLRDLQKYSNPNFLNNTEAKIVERVDLNDCEGFNAILDNVKFIYAPCRFHNSGLNNLLLINSDL